MSRFASFFVGPAWFDLSRLQSVLLSSVIVIGSSALFGVAPTRGEDEPSKVQPAHGPANHESAETPGEVLSLDASTDGDHIDVVMAVRDDPEPRLIHRRSDDGGRSWSVEHEVDLGGHPMHSPHRGMDPQVATDGDRVLVVWTEPGTSEWGSGPMATSYSPDRGATWIPGSTPADDGRTDGHNYIDAVADDRGTFHVVWLDTRSGGRGLSWSSSADGREWSSSRTIDDHTCECCWNRIYAGDKGDLTVLYRDKAPTDIVLAASRDRGETWKPKGAPGGFEWAFDGCPHVGGALAKLEPGSGDYLQALSWTGAEGRAGLWSSGSADGGASWSEPRRLGSDRARHSDLGAHGERLLAVWDGGAQILLARSGDRGSSWTQPEPISDPGRRATHPLVISGFNEAVVTWTEKDPTRGWRWVARRFEWAGD